MMRHRRDIRNRHLLADKASERNWINTCIYCQKTGYDPGMPEVLTIRGYGKSDHPTRTASQLRFYYPPLSVDENGVCDECRTAMKLKDVSGS